MHGHCNLENGKKRFIIQIDQFHRNCNTFECWEAAELATQKVSQAKRVAPGFCKTRHCLGSSLRRAHRVCRTGVQASFDMSHSSSADKEELIQDAIAWCAQHGLVYGAGTDCLLVHAPFALTPVPFPRQAFQRALDAAEPFNSMIDAVSQDVEYLTEVLENAAREDADFTGELMKIYKETRQQQQQQQQQQEEISLVITRSDYMLHDPTSTMLQVELNTIASSFGCLSTLVSQLHRYILDKSGIPESELDKKLPQNTSMDSIVHGLASAVLEHGHQDKTMMMVVQPDEQNSFDQQWLQLRLWTKYRVRTIRRTLLDIAERAVVEQDGSLMIDGTTVSLAYFRAGYTPTDYPSRKEWDARTIIELSNAAKCPTIGMQLAGSKKVQQDLARPGVVEKFSRSDTDAACMRTCFAGLWGLDDLESDKEAYNAVQDAIKNPDLYVLKPQREGGGNNLYGQDMVDRLQQNQGLGALILMQRILPPPHTVTMIRRGVATDVESLSELGIYGVLLRKGANVLVNHKAGQLVRTKASTSSEGGVAAGYAVLDSVQLID